MAIFRLGAIITEIRGSIGGTTLRTSRGNPVIYNKQSRQSTSAFNSNARKFGLGILFAAWQNLSQQLQQDWSDMATLFAFPDKFGNTRNLTGRQFFTKLNGQLTPFARESNVDTLNNYVPSAVITIGAPEIETQIFPITFDNTVINAIFAVQVYRVTKGAAAEPTKHHKVIFTIQNSDVSAVDIWDSFNSFYPGAQVGDKFGVNCYFANPSGFVSSIQSAAVFATT
jgi:hypothetical protein